MRRLACFVLLLVALAASPAAADKRLALVIGIDAYEAVPVLEKAVGDAQAVKVALEQLGFAVTLVTNPDRRTLNHQLAKFEEALLPGDTALVHFSGHGVEIEGENYLLPVDVPKPTSGNQNFVKDEAIGLTAIVERLKETGAATRILIIDACRDNPFEQVGVRSVGRTRGLTRVEAPKGTFIMYSAGYGQQALDRLGDSDPEPTSVFTRVLLRHMVLEGREITDIAKDVRSEVSSLASTIGHDQFPAYYDELSGRFFLKSGTGPGPLPPSTDPIARDYSLAERIATKEAWEGFLVRHGEDKESFYVQLAEAALKKHAAVDKPPRLDPVPYEPPTPPVHYPPEFNQTIAPSFDCTRAQARVERLICENAPLAEADGVMGNAFQKLLASLSDSDDRALRALQRQWIRHRDESCLTSVEAENCLLEATTARANELISLLNATNKEFPIEYAHISDPSFSCSQALSYTELLICGDRALAQADGVMGAAYKRLISKSSKARTSIIRTQQRDWLKLRDRTCLKPGEANPVSCLLEATRRRALEVLVMLERSK